MFWYLIGAYLCLFIFIYLLGSVCEWDDLNWVIRLHKKDTLQLDVFSGSTSNFSYIGSNQISCGHIMELRYEVDNVIVLEGKLYNEQNAPRSRGKKKSRSLRDAEDEGNERNRKIMGVFHIRANLEKGKDWDWFIQSYEKSQNKAERMAAEKSRLSASYSGPKEWLNIHTYFPLELQIVDVVVFNVHSSLGWIFKSRITMTLDAGRNEYTTDDNYAIVCGQDSAEWQKLQWELLVESPEVNLIYKIYAHGKYIGRYVLSAASLAEKLTATTHDLEFTGELVVNLNENDSKIIGKVMTKMFVNPTSGQEITRHRELNPTQPTIEDHLRPDYLVGLPAIFLFEKAELSATNLHSISFCGTYILRLHYEHYRFETKIDVPSRTKRVIIPKLDWQIPMHTRKKVTIILECTSASITGNVKAPALIHFFTDEFSALEKDENSGIIVRKFVFHENEIKAKVAFYVTVSLERDFTGVDKFMYDTDPKHNLRVVDPVYSKDGIVMVEGNQEFWEMQGKFYRSNNNLMGDEETKKGTLTLNEVRDTPASFWGNHTSTMDESVHTGDPVFSSNASLPVTLRVTEVLVTDLYNVHFLSKNSPRAHVICGKQASCTSVCPKAGAHAFWSGLEMSFHINSYDNPLRISVDSQETIIGECTITISDLLASRPNKTGMREMMSTLTISLKNQKKQTQHQIRGKVKLLYFLDQANKIGIPVSDIQLGALKYIDYPVQLVVHQIVASNLRKVHLFGRNSPLVKMVELGPDHSQFFTTSMLKQAGGYGKWKNLMWSSIVSDETTTFHFQVLSESMVIGSTDVSGDELLRMIPNTEGVCEMILALKGIEDQFQGGEIQVTYSYEPHIECDPDDKSVNDNAEDNVNNALNGSQPSQVSTASSSMSTGLFQSGIQKRLQVASTLPMSLSMFRSNSTPQPPLLQVVANPAKDHHLIMLCAVVIVLRKPKAKKVAAAKNRRSSNPEDYLVWNLSTTRAQLVCGKYVHAIRMKCQNIGGSQQQQSRNLWNDQDSTGTESFLTFDGKTNRNNNSIILRSNPLVEKFVMSDKKSLQLRLFDGNDLTIGDSMCSLKDVIENSPVTAAGFHICDRDLWKDGELVGLIRLQLRVSEDIPPIIRATLIDGATNVSQPSSLNVSHPSVWGAERRLAYPLGVKFHQILMMDINEELFIPKSLLQPTEHPEDPPDGNNNLPPALRLDQVEIFLRIRFAGERRVSMTTFAMSADVVEGGLVWEFAERGFSTAHDQETWILEVIAMGKVVGICKIPAFDLRYARELHLRQVEDAQVDSMPAATLLANLPDSTLYFNLWNAQKVVTGRVMLTFSLHELFGTSEDDDRARSILMVQSTPRIAGPGRELAQSAAIANNMHNNAAKATTAGFIRFTLLHAFELRQIYSMFPNSPRVKIVIGERMYETNELSESGGEGVWNQLSWGRIYLRSNIAAMSIIVQSHNEIIGSWEITTRDIIDSIRRARVFAESAEGKNQGDVVDESGTVTVQLTGVLSKNRRKMGKVTMRFLGHLFDSAENPTANTANKEFSFEKQRLLSPNHDNSIVDPERDHPFQNPESAIMASSWVDSQESMDGIPLSGIKRNQIDKDTTQDDICQSTITNLHRALDMAERDHHQQLPNNSFASSYNDGLPPPGNVVPQNTISSSISLTNEKAVPSETIDFQFVALSVSHVRRNPNEEAIEFSYRSPPKLFATCGGWSAETMKLSTVSESSVTTQFKWLVSRYPQWHFRTEGSPFLKICLHTDTKRLLGSVFISMLHLLEGVADPIGMMRIGRTLMSPNDEPVAHLEIVYRATVRIRQDQTQPWWISTGIDPNALNQSWSVLSASVSQAGQRPDQPVKFAHPLPNPTGREDENCSLYSSQSTLSMNTLHMLNTGDALAQAYPEFSINQDFGLVPPVLAPPFLLVVSRAALTQIHTPSWMRESDAMRNMIVIRAFTHYAGYATSTIATSSDAVYWEELDGNEDDAPLGHRGTALRSLEEDVYESNAREHAWQFRFFDWKEVLKMEVFNLAKPFGHCTMNAQDLLKLSRTMQGEINIELPVNFGRKQVALLHFTGKILPAPAQEEPSEEKTVASIAAELNAIEKNEHLACIMRMKFISCEDISVMAHEIRIKLVSEREGIQISPLLKNLFGRVVYAPDSWTDIKFFQRSLVTLSVVDQKGDVLGASTIDVYDILRAPIDQRAISSNLPSSLDTAQDPNRALVSTSRPSTADTQNSAAAGQTDPSYAGWTDTGSQSPRSQRRRRRRERWQNIAVMYLDLILGPAKRGRVAIAFERMSPSQYQAAIADDNMLSARSEMTDDSPIIYQLSPGWTITIQSIRLSHLKPVHQFGKNSPLITLEATGRRFQTDCRAFAGKKASFDDLSWMLDCREKVNLKFKVSSASVTVGLCSILMDELFVHPLDRHHELEVQRKLVKDKTEMGTIYIRLRGHPPLPPLSTNTGYIDSVGSIVTIRTQGENQSMHFRPVELSKNPAQVDYQSLLWDNMEAYHVMQEMDTQSIRSMTLASFSDQEISQVEEDWMGIKDDYSSIHSASDSYEHESGFHSIEYRTHDASTITSRADSLSRSKKSHVSLIEMNSHDVEREIEATAIGDADASESKPELHAKLKDDDNVSRNSKMQSSDSGSWRKASLQPSPAPQSQPVMLSGTVDRNAPSREITPRSWDGGISNNPATGINEAGRPRTSRGPELPRFLPKVEPELVTETKLSSSASIPSLPSDQSSKRRSTLTAQIPVSSLGLFNKRHRKFSLGSALEGTVSLPELDGTVNAETIDEESQDVPLEVEHLQEEAKEMGSLNHQQYFDGSTSQASLGESQASLNSSRGESTISFARPVHLGDQDADISLYSHRTRESMLSVDEDSSVSYQDDFSEPSSARSFESSTNNTAEKSNFSSRAQSRSESFRSSVHSSNTASTENSPRGSTPRETIDDGLELDNLEFTIGADSGKHEGKLEAEAIMSRPSFSSRPLSPEYTEYVLPSRMQPLKSILKPSNPLNQSSDDIASTHSIESKDGKNELQTSSESDEEENDEDGSESQSDDNVSDNESSEASSTDLSGRSDTSFYSTPQRPSPSEIEAQARLTPVPPLRLLFLRDEKPLPRNQLALLIGTDLTRAILIQVVSSFVAMHEGTSFMGARRHVANSLMLDFDQVALAQRRVLVSVDFVRQITYQAATQAYQKLVIQRRVADIQRDLNAKEQPEKAMEVNKSTNQRPDKKKSRRSRNLKATIATQDTSNNVLSYSQIDVVATTNAIVSPPVSPPHRRTLVKRMSVNISPKANMMKRQAVTMTSGVSNPMIEKRQKSQEWSDKLEKEMERNMMLSKPMRARIRILDFLGIDLAAIDAQVRPVRPYLTACKPFGNWAAETPAVKIEIIRPLPPALEARRSAAQELGQRDDEISLPSLWKDTVAFNAGQHPANQPSAYVLNFMELFGRFRWEEFILRMGQEILLEIRDAGSNLVVAKAILPYPMFISKLPGDQEIFESSLFIVLDVANEFGGGKLSGVLRVRLDLSVNVFVRTKKSAVYWDQHRPQHWRFYPLTPINFGAVRQKYREIAEDYDSQRLVHPSYFGFRVRIRGNEEDESRFLHPVFSGYNLAKKLSIAKSAAKDMKVQAMKTRAANPFRFDPSLKDLGKCPICGDGLPGCPRCFMMPTKEYDGSFYAPKEFAFDPAEERKKALQREQRIVAIKAKRRRRLSSMQFSSIENLNLESLGLHQILSHEKIRTTGMSMADITKEIEKLYDTEMDADIVQEERREQAKLRHLHTRLTTFQAIRAARLFLQRILNIYVKIMPTGNIVRVTMDANDPVHLLYDRFNWHYPTNKNHHPMMLLPTSNGYFELHPELSFENEMEIADNRGFDKLGEFLQVQNQTCHSFVVLYFAHYVRQAVAPLMQSFFAANTTFSLSSRLPTYSSIDRVPKDLVKDEVQQWCVKIMSVDYGLQQEENHKFFINLGKAFHQSSIAAKQKEFSLKKQEKHYHAQQKKLIQQRFASQLKRLGTGEPGSRNAKARRRLVDALESRERNKRKTQLFVDEKDNLLGTVKEDDSVMNLFVTKDDDDDEKSVLSLSAVQLDDLSMDGSFNQGEEDDVDSFYTEDDIGDGSSRAWSESEYTDASSYYTATERSETSALSDGPPPPYQPEDGKLIPTGDPITAMTIMKQQAYDQAQWANKLEPLLPKRAPLSTIPSLSLHDSQMSSSAAEHVPLASGRSFVSHLTESEYGSTAGYTRSDWDGDDYDSYYDDDENFQSFSDVESSIASRSANTASSRWTSDYSYSPQNSARSDNSAYSSGSSASTYTSRTNASEGSDYTGATPYTFLSAQSLQPYPSVMAEESDSVHAGILLPGISDTNRNAHTRLTHTQQHAQRNLQKALRQDTLRLQDQILGDRLPSTLELSQTIGSPSSPTVGGINLAIAPDVNGGIVPVKDIDDVMSIFSGHRQQQYPSKSEKRALDRLMMSKKKTLIRVLRPHEDAYGLGRGELLGAGGNADDSASLYSHRQMLEDDNGVNDSSRDSDTDMDSKRDRDEDSLYSEATSLTEHTSQRSRGSSAASSTSAGLFTYRDDVSAVSKHLYGDVSDEENIMSVQSMPSTSDSESYPSGHKRSAKKKKQKRVLAGTLPEQYYHQYLQGGNAQEDDASMYSNVDDYQLDSDRSISTSSIPSSYPSSNNYQSTSSSVSKVTGATGISSSGHSFSSKTKSSRSTNRHIPTFPPTIPDVNIINEEGNESLDSASSRTNSDGKNSGYTQNDDDISQVTFATQESLSSQPDTMRSNPKQNRRTHSQFRNQQENVDEDRDDESFRDSISRGNESLFSQYGSSQYPRSVHSSSTSGQSSGSVYSGSMQSHTRESETARNTSMNRSSRYLTGKEVASEHVGSDDDDGQSRRLDSARSRSSGYSYSSNPSVSSYDSYVTASSGYSDGSYFSTSSYNTASTQDSSIASSAPYAHSDSNTVHSQLGATSLLAPLTLTPASTAGRSGASYTGSLASSSYRGYGYLPDETETVRSDSRYSDAPPDYRTSGRYPGGSIPEEYAEDSVSEYSSPSQEMLHETAQNRSYDSALTQDEDDDDANSIVSESSHASSLSSASSFVRRKKALREIAQAMSELGDTDIEPLAAPAMSTKLHQSPT